MNQKIISIFVSFVLLAITAPTQAYMTDNYRFPFGVFDKSDPYGQFDKTDIVPGSNEWNEYHIRLVSLLKKYNINTFLNFPYRQDSHARFVLDLMHENNIQVIFQPGTPFTKKTPTVSPGYAENSLYSHPSIIAYKIGDEPKTREKLEKFKKKYELIRKFFHKPIVTAMIGEIMGETSPDNAFRGKPTDKYPNREEWKREDTTISMWKQLNSRIRFARNYPYRRTYDLLNWSQKKMKMPFHEWCDYMETVYGESPWWYVAQTFGKGKAKDHDSYWRFPTSSELNASIHTALAYGARGIIGWALQSYDVKRKPTRVMLLNKDLIPEVSRDGSYPIDQFGKIGALVSKHGDLLLRHTRANLEITGSNKSILKSPRIDPETGDLYIYIINLNTEAVQKDSLSISSDMNITSAVDIYTGKEMDIDHTNVSTTISYSLTPGEARFVRLY